MEWAAIDQDDVVVTAEPSPKLGRRRDAPTPAAEDHDALSAHLVTLPIGAI